MEINNFIEKVLEIGKKYSVNQIDKNGDGIISEEEILSMIEQDEEVSASLSTFEISETETVQDIGEVQSTSETQQVQKTTERKKVEIKTMEEYKEILDKKFDELWERVDKDLSKLKEYLNANPLEFCDITGDGRVDKIDLQIIENYKKMLPAYSSNSQEWGTRGKEWIQGIRTFGGLIRNQVFTKQMNDTNRYDLNDAENYIKLGGDASKLFPYLSISNIAQDENWEEKYDLIFQNDAKLYKEKGNRPQTTKNEIKIAEEYIKNHSQNAGMSGLVAKYISSNGVWDDTFTLARIDVDLNGDGIVDYKDIAKITLEFDLDGDGEITDKESLYMKKVKEFITKELRFSLIKSGMDNMNNIDNVIGSTELFDAEWENTVKAQAKYYAKDCEDVSKNITFYPVEWIGRGICNITGYGNLRRFTGYRDGRGGVNQIDNSMLPLSKSTDLVKLFTDCANFSKPANSYLHYIMSADLSKEQLEEILNKINSSSVSVQSQLVEIKEAIEEKLKNLS